MSLAQHAGKARLLVALGVHCYRGNKVSQKKMCWACHVAACHADLVDVQTNGY